MKKSTTRGKNTEYINSCTRIRWRQEEAVRLGRWLDKLWPATDRKELDLEEGEDDGQRTV